MNFKKSEVKSSNTMSSMFYDFNPDFNTICRTCLSINQELKPMFESGAAAMLNECNFIEVTVEDGFPLHLCIRCHDLLLQTYNFKKQCIESEITLKRLILANVSIRREEEGNDESISENFEDCNANETEALPKTVPEQACSNCNKKFHGLQALEKHMRIHAKRKRYNCSKCKASFTKVNDLKTHPCNKSHESEKEDVINTKSDTSEDLTAFLDEAPPPPLPFPCPDCTQSFNAQCDLDLHSSTHSKSGEFICSRCKKQFATRQVLKRHVKTHMLHKPHICRECGKGFAESHALTKHLRKHTGQPREKKHLCTVCGQGYSEPFYLNLHMRKHTGERPLMCAACGKSFADPRSLKAHNMTHTGERPYKCNICGKAFSQSVNLTKHIRVHTGEKPYVCSECGKCFTQSSSLDKHSRTHTGERPYACEHCPKRFAERGTLIHHTRTHTGEKPYICEQCGRSFASSSELKLHDRKHSGIKKNICSVCGKDFATPSNLLVHSRTHSGEKPFSCTECGRAFADKGSMKKHLRIHTYKYSEEKNIAEQNCSGEQTFATMHSLNGNLETLQTVIERSVDIGLNDRLYFNLT